MTGRPITLQAIALATAATFNMAPALLKEKSRLRKIARPRHIAFYLARELTNYSYPRIGQFFNKDHSTVIGGAENIANLILRKPSVLANVNRVRETLRLRGYDA